MYKKVFKKIINYRYTYMLVLVAPAISCKVSAVVLVDEETHKYTPKICLCMV